MEILIEFYNLPNIEKFRIFGVIVLAIGFVMMDIKQQYTYFTKGYSSVLSEKRNPNNLFVNIAIWLILIGLVSINTTCCMSES